MKRTSLKLSILLVSIATSLWFLVSWWHYSCNIKNACGQNTQTFAANKNIDTDVNAPLPSIKSSDSLAVIDTDSDGLSDIEEARLGTDPLLKDTDGDGIPDNEEVGVNFDSPLDTDKDGIIDALDSDDDNDGIATQIEEKVGTSPLRADTDNDGLSDAEEIGKNTDKPLDTDNDGIINALDTDDDDDGIETITENTIGTNPLLPDTDGDGISDAQEVGELQNKPIDSDSDGSIDALDTEDSLDQDGDGLTDKMEAQLHTNPTKTDSDADGIDDATEVGPNILIPLDKDLDGIIDALDIVDDSDTDNDGLTDAQEQKLGSDPKEADTDNDGINDREEIGKNIDDPLDSDADGVLNILDKDDDNDNLSTRYEMRIGTNPLSDDSDKDSLKDNIEAKSPNSDALQNTDNDELINPVDTDDDNDKIPTLIELSIGTDPLKQDTDNDGVPDNIEVGENFESPNDTDGNGIIDAIQPSNEMPVVEKPEIIDDKTIDVATNVTSETTADKKIDAATILTPENTAELKTQDIDILGQPVSGSIQSSIFYFPFLSSNPVLSDKASTYFANIANWMKQSPDNQIRLTGHTDNVGPSQANLALGIRRVMVVRELLIDKGAPISQIDIMSRGESQPIADNNTEDGRVKNRRVEISPL